MKAEYLWRRSQPMADLDPNPGPIPIPIKIISDPAPSPSEYAGTPEPSKAKRSDDFYEAWDKFLALEPKRAKSISTAARRLEEEKKAVEGSASDGLEVKENASTSWEQAAAECRAKVAAIIEECKRLNQKYRDAVFDLETNQHCIVSLHGRVPEAVTQIDEPPWIKRVEDIFDDPQFFIDGATATDIHQGSGGDCWFLAALMAVSAKKELIDNLCVARDEQIGVYGFVFYRDGEWIYEVIDDKLFLRVGDDDNIKVVRDWDKDKKEGMRIWHDEEKLLNQLQRGGESLYFSHCKSSETWLPLIEKAYAKAHGDYAAIEGGWASEAIEDLTGGVGVVINPEDIMDKDRFWKEQLSQVNEKYLFGGNSKSRSTKGVVANHAYAVLKTWEEGDLKLVKLRNPWGETEWDGDWSDGSKLWTPDMMRKLDHTFGDDGVFWMNYKDFLKHFPSINRLRLFNKDWQVAQQWTCVNVPWTVDYLDTHFEITVTKRCPMVIVLSQPDERYFFGLEGRFWYSLHFRVYKEGQKDRWIVRSMHNSGNDTIATRSVSAEIEDLEPGTYIVLFKVTPARSRRLRITQEEAIMKYAVDRKEKLLDVGRRFDYAATKGNLRAMEENNKKCKKQESKDTQKASWKKARRINQQEKERARKRKKRVNDAMREKRRAFEEKRREKARLKRQRTADTRDNESTDAQAGGGGERKSDSEAEATPKTGDSPSSTENKPVPFESKSDAKAEVAPQTEESPSSTAGNAKLAEAEKGPGESSGQSDSQEALAKGLSRLELRDTRASSRDPSEDDEYESPVEPPEELSDNDFDWDSELDGAVDSSEEDDAGMRFSASGSENEIFADDPWNATCVLGLRVYSLQADAKIKVVKGENTS